MGLDVVYTPVLSPKRLVLEDHFFGGSIEVGETGQLGWDRATIVTAGTIAEVVGVAAHPGIIKIQSDATPAAGEGVGLQLAPSATGEHILATEIERFLWIVRPVNVTSTEIRAGVGENGGNSTFGTLGVFFEFDASASAFWRTVTRTASTSTTNTTAVTVTANNWYKLEAVRLSSGNWEFYINEALQFTHSANLPTAAVFPAVNAINESTTQSDVDLDYFGLVSVALGQQWT